jgi:predicted TIM-barrel fold metal-dependent hydrolase
MSTNSRTRAPEAALEPELIVIDTHHHLHDKPGVEHKIGRAGRFLVDEYAQLVDSGHRVLATVCVEARAMYRADGPEEFKCVGETEFLNGQAAMAASGLYGPCRVGAGIVAYADLRRGDAIRPVLEAHLEAAPHRMRGIRYEGAWDEDESIVGWLFDCGPKVYADAAFLQGFRHLQPLGLSFDAFVLSPQIPDVEALARRFPDTPVIFNHLGIPVGVGRHQGKLQEEFPGWREDVQALACCENVTVKLGGLGSFISGFPSYGANTPASSAQLADEWRPYVETAIEAFGAERCMWESNLPTDASGHFATVCNAFKRLVVRCSPSEKQAVFAGTAARIYRLNIPELTGRFGRQG